MRRLKWSGLAVVLALVAAGVAVAEEGENRSTKAFSVTFSAESGEHVIRTCKGQDGRYRRIAGEWEGEAESAEGAFKGELVLRGTAWVHVPTGNGAFEGRLQIGGENGAKGSVHAVLKEGKLEGFFSGHAGTQEARVLANLSASFTAEEITDAKLGGGGGANTAVMVKGECAKRQNGKAEEKRKEEEPKKESEKGERQQREFSGTVAALDREFLTVSVGGDSVKCELTAGLAAELHGYLTVGAKVVAVCYLEDGHWHLLKAKKLEDGAGSGEKAERKAREAQGEIAAFGEGSITVAADGKEPLTCSVGERMAAELGTAGYEVGTKVHAMCVNEGHGFVLVKIRKL